MGKDEVQSCSKIVHPISLGGRIYSSHTDLLFNPLRKLFSSIAVSKLGCCQHVTEMRKIVPYVIIMIMTIIISGRLLRVDVKFICTCVGMFKIVEKGRMEQETATTASGVVGEVG